MGNVRFDFGGMLELQRQLAQFTPEKIERFMIECTQELAARLLRSARKKTPVGNYSGEPYTCASGVSHKGSKRKDKRGGTLRNSWTVSAVEKHGNMYRITLSNTAKSDSGIPYAEYVEFGHRTRNGGFVGGHFMLTKSEDELRRIMDRIINKKLREFLEGGQ